MLSVPRWNSVQVIVENARMAAFVHMLERGYGHIQILPTLTPMGNRYSDDDADDLIVVLTHYRDCI